MSSSSVVIGHEVATDLRVSAHPSTVPGKVLSTVLDLLDAVDPSRPKKFPGLWTTASHLASCANMPISEMSIGMLTTLAPEFGLWLKDRRFSPKSISTYDYNLRRLIDKAQELGFTEGEHRLREAWMPIAEALKRVRLAPRSLPRFALSRGKGPASFTEDDLKAWGDWTARRGRKHRTVRIQMGLFKQAVRKARLEHLLPRFNCNRRFTTYGIPVSQMPEPLQSQVKKLLVWKQAKFAPGRPQKTRHCKVSARLLESLIRRLYGFATTIGGWERVETLPDLFSQPIVSAYAEWAINERQLSTSSLFRLSMIYSAVRHHPEFKNCDYAWFVELCRQFPEDDKTARQARKAKKKVPYDLLMKVPSMIISHISDDLSLIERSWLLHDALIMDWFVTLAWRQRNVREYRLGSPETANLFFAPLDRFVHVAKAAWVEQVLEKNAATPLWQFYFRENETKMHHEVRGILPQRLVPRLEQYLSEARPNIVASCDPGTLFVNRGGGALDRQVMTELVAELTFKHTGVRVTPHVIRDIFGYAYLGAHPKDYLTLSKTLWHGTLKHTLDVYAADFDESDGVSRVDDWLGSR